MMSYTSSQSIPQMSVRRTSHTANASVPDFGRFARLLVQCLYSFEFFNAVKLVAVITQ